MSRDEAIAELARCAGTQFDREVVGAFCAELAIPPAEREPIRALSAGPEPTPLAYRLASP